MSKIKLARAWDATPGWGLFFPQLESCGEVVGQGKCWEALGGVFFWGVAVSVSRCRLTGGSCIQMPGHLFGLAASRQRADLIKADVVATQLLSVIFQH